MKPSKPLTWALAATLGCGLALTAHAQEKAPEPKATQTIPSTEMVDGEIRKVDKDAKKITIKHAEIKSLDMPPMTMVFQVKDPALLDKVKAGDKVKFSVEKSGGAMLVTEIQPGK